jgi:two-component system, NarL family, nitrate/nitrite response regulator NarL
MSRRMLVVLADDHAPTRQEIRLSLEADPRFVVCAEAEDAAGAIEAAVRRRPDLCVLDINMPGSGIAAAWEITSRLPRTTVVMLTVSEDENDLFAALRAGATGYLLKDTDSSRLPHVLWDALQGETAMPRALMARVVAEFRDRSPARRRPLAGGAEARLTSREWQVLDLMRRDLATAQMARRLSLSTATVRSHRAAILRKLRASDEAGRPTAR